MTPTEKVAAMLADTILDVTEGLLPEEQRDVFQRVQVWLNTKITEIEDKSNSQKMATREGYQL